MYKDEPGLLTERDALLAVVVSIFGLFLEHGAQVHSTHAFVSKNTALEVGEQRRIQLLNALRRHASHSKSGANRRTGEGRDCTAGLEASVVADNLSRKPVLWEDYRRASYPCPAHEEEALSVRHVHTSHSTH